MPTVYARTLRRAAEIVGGVQTLGSQLGVGTEDLVYWLQGTKSVPQEIFLRAVDIVVAHDVREMSGRHPNLDNPGGNRST
jgi:hypothetical protein